DRTRGNDSLTAFQKGGSQYRECLDAQPNQCPSQSEHDGIPSVLVVEDSAKGRLGFGFQDGDVSLVYYSSNALGGVVEVIVHSRMTRKIFSLYIFGIECNNLRI